MHPKYAEGIANSVDPDPRAVWSESALFAQTYLSENITVTSKVSRKPTKSHIKCL